MTNCKWLSDEFSYICCNAECREYIADACPYGKDEQTKCGFYERKKPECCNNCEYLFDMGDWTDYPHGRFNRKVCGAFSKEKYVMALYENLDEDICECYTERKSKNV